MAQRCLASEGAGNTTQLALAKVVNRVVFLDFTKEMNCARCKMGADVVVEYEKGCLCNPSALCEPLCIQHLVQATPFGWIEIIEVLPGPWEQHIRARWKIPSDGEYS